MRSKTKECPGVPRDGTAEMNPTKNHQVAGLIPGLAQWIKDPVLLWPWCRLAAVALTGPLGLGTSIRMSQVWPLKKKKKGKQQQQKQECQKPPEAGRGLDFPLEPLERVRPC